MSHPRVEKKLWGLWGHGRMKIQPVLSIKHVHTPTHTLDVVGTVFHSCQDPFFFAYWPLGGEDAIKECVICRSSICWREGVYVLDHIVGQLVVSLTQQLSFGERGPASLQSPLASDITLIHERRRRRQALQHTQLTPPTSSGVFMFTEPPEGHTFSRVVSVFHFLCHLRANVSVRVVVLTLTMQIWETRETINLSMKSYSLPTSLKKK